MAFGNKKHEQRLLQRGAILLLVSMSLMACAGPLEKCKELAEEKEIECYVDMSATSLGDGYFMSNPQQCKAQYEVTVGACEERYHGRFLNFLANVFESIEDNQIKP